MLDVTLGAGLIIIALSAQYLLSRRAKNAKIGKVLAWVAWCFAVVGGTAVTVDIQDLVGVTSAGAAAASVVMLLFIAVDVADRRPDWLAFILICIAPTFMRLTGGGIGTVFDLLLAVPAWAASQLSAFLGM
jgi:hypothetical protein